MCFYSGVASSEAIHHVNTVCNRLTKERIESGESSLVESQNTLITMHRGWLQRAVAPMELENLLTAQAGWTLVT